MLKFSDAFVSIYIVSEVITSRPVMGRSSSFTFLTVCYSSSSGIMENLVKDEVTKRDQVRNKCWLQVGSDVVCGL